MNEETKTMDRNKMLNDILGSDNWEAFEIIGNLRVAISRCVINEYSVWIWGSGERILPFIKALENEGISVEGIIDIDEAKIGKTIKNIIIVSPQEFYSFTEKDNSFVFMWTSCFEGNSQEKMISELNQNGVLHWYKVTNEDKNQICYFTNHDHEQYYLDNRRSMETVVDKLYDDYSVEEYLEYIRTYIENSSWKRKECDTANKYFYGGTIKEPEQIYVHIDDEVWLNCGCHVGDTISCFFSKGLKAKKIFAVDGKKNHIIQCKDNMSFLPSEASRVIEFENVFIDKDTDFDSLFHGEKLTLINADIEGAELQLVKDMQEVITVDRPVLALCLYHKVSDAVEIPYYLMNTLKDYYFVVRKYPSYYAFSYRNFELVLYAIPKERIALNII